MSNFRILPCLGLVALLAAAEPAFACPSGLDASFGSGGVALWPNPGNTISTNTPLVLENGDILVPGEIDKRRPMVTRFRSDGTIDPSFGEGGVVRVVLPDSYRGGFFQLAVQEDGKIVAAGSANVFDGEDAFYAPLLVRLDATGALDPTFGNGGIVLLPALMGDDEFFVGVAVRSDGVIAALHRFRYAPSDGRAESTVRYFTPNGAPATTLGPGGIAALPIPAPTAVTGLLRLDDDSIIVSGIVEIGDTAIAKLRPDGTPDSSFGSGGAVVVRTKHYEEAWSIGLDRTGRILTGGDFSHLEGRNRILVRRFLPNGKIDRSYGRKGRASIPFGRAIAARGLAIDHDGRATLTAFYVGGSPANRPIALIARFDGNGLRDSAFGTRGVQRLAPIPPTRFYSVAAQPDGKLVFAGESALNRNGSFTAVLVRFQGGAECAAGCGNGVVEGTELCDNGPANSNTVPGACRTNCQPSECGDWVQDQNEECDDGNRDDCDGCTFMCTQEFCGDDIVQQCLGEQCDDGVDNGYAPNACRPDCTPARCGDGVFDPGEECDDWNTQDGDGCSSQCFYEHQCGDGIVQLQFEECDDGDELNSYSPDACRPNCLWPRCADGVQDTGEECDDGNMDSGDGCSPQCTAESAQRGNSLPSRE